MRTRHVDLDTLIAAERGRVTNIMNLGRNQYGKTFVKVDCGLDTPPEVALAAAQLRDDDSVEAVHFSHRRTMGGGQLIGWVYTIEAWANGANSSLATGCVEALT